MLGRPFHSALLTHPQLLILHLPGASPEGLSCPEYKVRTTEARFEFEGARSLPELARGALKKRDLDPRGFCRNSVPHVPTCPGFSSRRSQLDLHKHKFGKLSPQKGPSPEFSVLLSSHTPRLPPCRSLPTDSPLRNKEHCQRGTDFQNSALWPVRKTEVW